MQFTAVYHGITVRRMYCTLINNRTLCETKQAYRMNMKFSENKGIIRCFLVSFHKQKIFNAIILLSRMPFFGAFALMLMDCKLN